MSKKIPITLTESLSRGEVKKLMLNVAYISHIQEGLNGSDTHVRMMNLTADKDNRACYYFVKESFAEISLMLNGPLPTVRARKLTEYVPLNGA